MRIPFDGAYPQTQDWNDPRYRSMYTQFGLLGHNGEDYGLPSGTRVIAPHGGRIIEAAFDAGGYGNYVKIEDATQGSVLAHLSKISVQVGNAVIEGNEIGLSGNTGYSTAPHLHWGYYRIPRNRTNGFFGYIDQSDWINVVIGSVDEALKRELEVLKQKIQTAKAALG